MIKKQKLFTGKDAKYTHWGSWGCSHGMYSRGGYDRYVYGIKGIFTLIIIKCWGDMSDMEVN